MYIALIFNIQYSMKMKYFTVTEYTTPDELKRHYRFMCKTHHPDRGGSDETQAQINAEYQQALELLAEQAKRTGDRESSEMIVRLMQQHLYNMYTEMKTPLIKRYIPQEYQGLAFEISKMIEERWG